MMTEFLNQIIFLSFIEKHYGASLETTTK